MTGIMLGVAGMWSKRPGKPDKLYATGIISGTAGVVLVPKLPKEA